MTLYLSCLPSWGIWGPMFWGVSSSPRMWVSLVSPAFCSQWMERLLQWLIQIISTVLYWLAYQRCTWKAVSLAASVNLFPPSGPVFAIVGAQDRGCNQFWHMHVCQWLPVSTLHKEMPRALTSFSSSWHQELGRILSAWQWPESRETAGHATLHVFGVSWVAHPFPLLFSTLPLNSTLEYGFLSWSISSALQKNPTG